MNACIQVPNALTMNEFYIKTITNKSLIYFLFLKTPKMHSYVHYFLETIEFRNRIEFTYVISVHTYAVIMIRID